MDFSKLTLKDFENIEGFDIRKRANVFGEYCHYHNSKSHVNYRIVSTSGSGPEMTLLDAATGKEKNCISFVSNDYLGFTQHPQVKKAAIQAVMDYGTGAGASPLIGGNLKIHEELEYRIARFFRAKSALTFTTGYTANSAIIQALLKKEDIAIMDMGVHASVMEGCQGTNTKFFLHNDLQGLERILKETKDQYRTRLVIIDGVYSQDGDVAPLAEMVNLTKTYGAYLMLDDAHGIGVLGDSGRGLIEVHDLFDKVDIITGTFSKAFASLGGFVVADPEIINLLKFYSRQNIFSAAATPAASATALKALELIDEEPFWRQKLWNNIEYFKNGLHYAGFEIGDTASAIFPIKIGDDELTKETGKLLLDAGIYANPILFPAVSRKNSRIRMSILATHNRQHLDKALEVLEHISYKFNIKRREPVLNRKAN